MTPTPAPVQPILGTCACLGQWKHPQQMLNVETIPLPRVFAGGFPRGAVAWSVAGPSVVCREAPFSSTVTSSQHCEASWPATSGGSEGAAMDVTAGSHRAAWQEDVSAAGGSTASTSPLVPSLGATSWGTSTLPEPTTPRLVSLFGCRDQGQHPHGVRGEAGTAGPGPLRGAPHKSPAHGLKMGFSSKL